MAFEDIRQKAAQVVELLTPDTKAGGSDTFVEYEGAGSLLDASEGGSVVFDRMFEIFGSAGGPTNFIGVPDRREFEGQLNVLVTYAPEMAQRRLTRARIDEDWDLISRAIIKKTNYFSDSSTKTYAIFEADDGVEIDEESNPEGPWFALYPFRVIYETVRS